MPTCGPSLTCHRVVYIQFSDIFLWKVITESKDGEIVFFPTDTAAEMTEPARFQRSGATWRPAHRELHWDVHPTFLMRNLFSEKQSGVLL